ncbi:hypothetical protein K402DRAFT_399116, partial [Aulographum hederae CBS 113979]
MNFTYLLLIFQTSKIPSALLTLNKSFPVDECYFLWTLETSSHLPKDVNAPDPLGPNGPGPIITCHVTLLVLCRYTSIALPLEKNQDNQHESKDIQRLYCHHRQRRALCQVIR